MRSLAILFVCCCAIPAQATLLMYEGYTPAATQTGPYNYQPGEPMAAAPDPNAGHPNGQFNTSPPGQYWRYAGNGTANTAAPGLAGSSGSLIYPGLAASSGNSMAFDFTQLGTTRIQIPTGPFTSGTIYWSALLRVNDVGNLSSTSVGGAMLAGFNNGTGPGTQANVTSVGAVLRIKKHATNPDAYLIGTGLNQTTTSPNLQYDTTARAEGDTIFLVGSYQFDAVGTSDLAKLWINPSALTFGNNALQPVPALSSGGGSGATDAFASLASFNLRNVNTLNVGAGPTANVQFDELRIGTDWASVTAIPEALPFFVLLLVSALLVAARAKAWKLLGT
jgi:hypothetical protein